MKRLFIITLILKLMSIKRQQDWHFAHFKLVVAGMLLKKKIVFPFLPSSFREMLAYLF